MDERIYCPQHKVRYFWCEHLTHSTPRATVNDVRNWAQDKNFQKPLTVDEVFKKYAAEIDKMYEQRTRGDFSSIGILSEFAREYDKAKNAQ